jgi:methylmalonyl-CoA/ethylmalonyl-CoA epimerase
MDSVSDLRLHHIGIVVAKIEDRRDFYIRTLQYQERTPVIHDPIQTAFVQFLFQPGSDHLIELVAPDGEASHLSNASRKGSPLNHLCYSCDEIAESLAELRDAGCFVVREPTPGVAFEGRPIAWVMSPHRLLMELVERGPAGSL